MRIPRCRKFKYFAQGCTASKWLNQGSNPSSQALEGYLGSSHNPIYSQKVLPLAPEKWTADHRPPPTCHRWWDQGGHLCQGGPPFDLWQPEAWPGGEGVQARPGRLWGHWPLEWNPWELRVHSPGSESKLADPASQSWESIQLPWRAWPQLTLLQRFH